MFVVQDVFQHLTFFRARIFRMEFLDEKVVKLTSSDNELFELSASAAKISKLILEQLEGFVIHLFPDPLTCIRGGI
jgi:hypothetical protein